MPEVLSRIPGFRQLRANHLSQQFADFVRGAWSALHPGRKLVWSWHYDLLAEVLMAVTQGQLRRVIFNQPPRTLKTTIASICWPVWVWLTEPTRSFLCVSYSKDLAVEHSLARRNLILSPWYQRLFSDRFTLSEDRNRVDEFSNDQGGVMLATSVGSSVQGRGADIALLDDPLDMDGALSDASRKSSNEWLHHTLFPRLNDPATSPIVLCAQRLHTEDTTQFLLDGAAPDTWTHLAIPLLAEEAERWVFPLSRRIVERKAGDVLLPSRFPPKVVEELQARRTVWNAEFQQRPVPLEGNLIKRSEVRYYGGSDANGNRDEELPREYDAKIISVDCAFKDRIQNDFVAILVIGVKGPRRYVLHAVNAHLDAGATEDEILRQHKTFTPVSAVLVEDAANGPAIIKRLQCNIPGVIAIRPEGGKFARMFASAPEWQAGNWFVKRAASWGEQLVEQIVMFPSARHDDLADAMSQASIWLQAHAGYGTPVPFQRVPAEREAAEYYRRINRSVPARYPDGFAGGRGFWQPSPVLPAASVEWSPQALQAFRIVTDDIVVDAEHPGGRRPTEHERIMAMNTIMWNSVRGVTGE
jgi:predicted phage terminase large subunit-like protein